MPDNSWCTSLIGGQKHELPLVVFTVIEEIYRRGELTLPANHHVGLSVPPSNSLYVFIAPLSEATLLVHSFRIPISFLITLGLLVQR